MKNFTLLALFLTIYTNILANDVIFAPFYGSSTYKNATKDKATNYGFYFKNGNFKSVIEYQDVKYSPDNNDSNITNPSNFTQTNLSLAYKFNIAKNTDLLTSLQYINSSNKNYDGLYSVLLGIKKKFNNFSLGLNYSYSDYSNTTIKTVQQATPYIGFRFGDYKSLMGTYYIKIMNNFIMPDAKVQSISSDYSTFGISLTQNKGDFQNFVQYWSGDSIFAIRDNGLSIQNFEEIYEKALSISSKYSFSSTTSVQLSYIEKDFSDYSSSSTSTLTNTILFLYFKF